MATKIIRPQKKQALFLANAADICIYGGAAGGGKTYALLLDTLRFYNNPNARYTIFRKYSGDITGPGGLYDVAMTQIYNTFNVHGQTSPKTKCTFPSGYTVSFDYMQYDKDVLRFQGLQLPVIAYDELTHFSRYQFTYLLSRNRAPSNSGIVPYIRATTNPEPDSWVREFLDWWIDPETGYAIPERSGAIRWMVMIDDEMIWADSKQELIDKSGCSDDAPLSVSFISSSLEDNPALLKSNPRYKAALQAMNRVLFERLYRGNWNIKAQSGELFKESYFDVINSIDKDNVVAVCRAWDLAATAVSKKNKDPDATASCLMAMMKDGTFVVLDVTNDRMEHREVMKMILSKARADRDAFGDKYTVFIPQDPGQAGKSQAASMVSYLAGFNVKTDTVKGDKETRALPLVTQCEHRNVLLLNGEWRKRYIYQLESFPNGAHDDMVDASSDAFRMISEKNDAMDSFLSFLDM